MKIFKFGYGLRSFIVGSLVILVGVYATGAIAEGTGRIPIVVAMIPIFGLIIIGIGIKTRLKGQTYEDDKAKRQLEFTSAGIYSLNSHLPEAAQLSVAQLDAYVEQHANIPAGQNVSRAIEMSRRAAKTPDGVYKQLRKVTTTTTEELTSALKIWAAFCKYANADEATINRMKQMVGR